MSVHELETIRTEKDVSVRLLISIHHSQNLIVSSIFPPAIRDKVGQVPDTESCKFPSLLQSIPSSDIAPLFSWALAGVEIKDCRNGRPLQTEEGELNHFYWRFEFLCCKTNFKPLRMLQAKFWPLRLL